MVILIVFGIVKDTLGELHAHSLHLKDHVAIGRPGSGLLLGASLFIVMKSFAAGGSALTGTEAISNGVSVFRQPEARNARQTLVIMAVILGTLVMGVAFLASVVHPVPRIDGTPTVVAQIAKYVYGHGALGSVLYIALQGGTMLILVLAANTSFTGFPFLASFAAADSYLPRALTRRGHRLVFSTGIIVLTVVSIVAAGGDQRRGGQPDPPLRHRRLHRLHHRRGRHGQVPPDAPGTAVAAPGRSSTGRPGSSRSSSTSSSP